MVPSSEGGIVGLNVGIVGASEGDIVGVIDG